MGGAGELSFAFPQEVLMMKLRIVAVLFALTALLAGVGSYVAFAQGEPEPLVFGQEMTAEISAPDEVDVYTFEGQAGLQVSFFVDAEEMGNAQLWLTLLGPDGEKVAGSTSFRNVSLGNVALPADGIYTLQFDVQGEATGVYTLRSYAVTEAEAVPLVLGEEVERHIEPTEKALYTFEGQAGLQVSFFVDAEEMGNAQLWLTLLGPDGEKVAGDTGFRNVSLGNVSLPADGVYTLQFDVQGEATGAYTIRSYAVTEAEAAPLVLGEEIEGRIEPTEKDLYTFEGQAGLQVSFFVSSEEMGNAQLWLTLLGPDGEKVAGNTGFRNVSLGNVALPADGVYTLQFDVQGEATGTYTLRSYVVTEAEAFPLVLGEEVQGRIEPTEKDLYTFEGQAGLQVSFFVSSDELGHVQMWLTLFDPDGEKMIGSQLFGGISLVNVTLPADGTYTLQFDVAGEATGAYTLRSYAIPPAEPEPLGFGEEKTGEIAPPTEQDLYTFQGEAEEEIGISVSSEDMRMAEMWLTLLDPDGEEVARNRGMGSVSIDRILLPADGLYTLVYDVGGEALGSYTIHLQHLAPSQFKPESPVIEVVFVFDTSGSMDDEMAALCQDIGDAVTELTEARGIVMAYTIMGITEGAQCTARTVRSEVADATVSQFEDWGWAVADVARGYNWTPGAIRLIIPLGDEGPAGGDPVEDPGADRDSIEEAIATAKANNVVVSPVLGTGYTPEIEALARDLAEGTEGDLLITVDPEYDLVAGILRLIGLTVERHAEPTLPVRSFTASVPLPSEVDFSAKVVSTNVALALGLALAFGFLSTLFNNTLKENEDELRGWLSPLTARISVKRQPVGGEVRRRPWWFTLVLLVITTLIYAFLDFTFAFNAQGMMFLLSLFISVAITTYVYEGLQAFLGIRLYGLQGYMRAFPVAALIAIGCVILTRLVRFQPGYLFGFVAAYVLVSGEDFDEEATTGQGAVLVLVPAVVMLAVSIVAWLLSGPLAGVNLLRSLLVTTFVSGLEGVLFSLVPLSFLDGEVLFRGNRVAWLGGFAFAAYWFFQILLNPRSGYLDAFTQNNVVVTLILLALCGVITGAFWLFFRLRGRDGE
jgi:hypothetical protein